VLAGAQPIIDPQLVPALFAAIPAVLLLGLTFVALLRLQRLRGRARVLVDPSWLTALAATQQRFGFKHGTALLVSQELSSPISWGVLRPVILLDPRAAADSGQAEAIVAHELAHVARLDWAKLLIGRIACALFWFNPLVWILARSCHELREEAADDAVLRTDVASADYAALLVGVARHENRGMLLAANGVAPSRGSLSRRVVRVLDSACSRAQAGIAWTLACSLAAALVTIGLAVVTFAGPAGEAAAVTVSRDEGSPASRAAIAGGLDSPILAEALVDSAGRGDVRNLAQLLALGVSPDAVSPGDGTALIAAVDAGRIEVVRFLLARGANVDLAASDDGSPLIVASRSGRRALVELLLENGAAINAAVPDDGSPLTAAAAAGHAEIVALLLDRGASIEQVVPGEETALISASRKGQEEVVRLLLRRGADVNRQADGRTALNMAQAGGHSGIESLLREAGATR
jgi:beta-lactamase regulating signal transducer with metallopeptidase domain